jgi:hypothetical protein
MSQKHCFYITFFIESKKEKFMRVLTKKGMQHDWKSAKHIVSVPSNASKILTSSDEKTFLHPKSHKTTYF